MMQWHYSQGGKIAGPVEEEVLAKMAKDGDLKPNDLVWNKFMGQTWAKASTVPVLFAEDPDGGSKAVNAEAARMAGHEMSNVDRDKLVRKVLQEAEGWKRKGESTAVIREKIEKELVASGMAFTPASMIAKSIRDDDPVSKGTAARKTSPRKAQVLWSLFLGLIAGGVGAGIYFLFGIGWELYSAAGVLGLALLLLLQGLVLPARATAGMAKALAVLAFLGALGLGGWFGYNEYMLRSSGKKGRARRQKRLRVVRAENPLPKTESVLNVLFSLDPKALDHTFKSVQKTEYEKIRACFDKCGRMPDAVVSNLVVTIRIKDTEGVIKQIKIDSQSLIFVGDGAFTPGNDEQKSRLSSLVRKLGGDLTD